jgi:hypothetical protein
MLDREKENKVCKCTSQASIRFCVNSFMQIDRGQTYLVTDVPLARPGTSLLSSPRPLQQPLLLDTKERSMTTPNLSLAIPLTGMRGEIAVAGPNIPNAETVVFSDKEHVPNDDGSDVTSICQSPSWDNTETKKRKAEKREARERHRKWKESTELELKDKQRQRLQKRPNKAPPPSKVSKIAISTDSSISVSATQASNESQSRRGKKETRPRGGSRSLDLGFKGFLNATKAVSGPWISPQPITAEGGQSTRLNGFIGGIKLKKADEAVVQEGAQKQNPSHEEDQHDSSGGGDYITSNESPGGNLGGQIQELESRSNLSLSQNWTAFDQSSYSAKIAKGTISRQTSETTTLIMDRRIRRDRKTGTSAVESISPDPKPSKELEPESQDISTDPIPSGKGDRNPEKRMKAIKPPRPISERPPVSYRAPPEETMQSSRGRGPRGGYVWSRRQQSKESSISTFEDEYLVSTGAAAPVKYHSRTRSWSLRSRTRKGDIISRPSTASQNTFISNEVEHSNHFIADNGPSRPFEDQQNVSSSIGIPTVTSGKLSRSGSRTPSFKGFKSVAKAAFSRHLSGSPATAFKPDDGSTPKSEQNCASTSNEDIRVKKILGSPVYPLTTQESSGIRPVSSGIASSNNYLKPRPQYSSSANPQTNASEATDTASPPFQSILATDLSRESILCEFTNTTTPDVSRPQSKKGLAVSTIEKVPQEFSNGLSSHPIQNRSTSSLMNGNLESNDSDSTGEGWGRMTTPGYLNDDKGRIGTPAGDSSILNSPSLRPGGQVDQGSHSSISPGKEHEASVLQGRPSHSGFITTPDPHDLSFLPELKHRPLGPPSQPKDKSPIKKAKHENPGLRLAIRPSLPSPHSASSSSIPSISTQQPVPRPPLPLSTLQSSKRSTPPLAHEASIATVEPLAKMFVICCGCRYFHDLPSKIYECMAKPDDVVEDRERGVSGVISTAVKCPWCGHGMSTRCCEGYATVVYLSERLH